MTHLLLLLWYPQTHISLLVIGQVYGTLSRISLDSLSCADIWMHISLWESLYFAPSIAHFHLADSKTFNYCQSHANRVITLSNWYLALPAGHLWSVLKIPSLFSFKYLSLTASQIWTAVFWSIWAWVSYVVEELISHDINMLLFETQFLIFCRISVGWWLMADNHYISTQLSFPLMNILMDNEDWR